MKHILLLTIFISLPFLSKAQTVSETQMPMITKITATWCPNCGTYGWSFFRDAIEDNQDNAIFIAAHPSGDLVSDEGKEFNSNLSANGQPKFYLNNQDFGVNAGNGAAKRPELKQAVDEMNGLTALVGTGIEVTRSGNVLTAKTKVRFLGDADGKYHLVVYAIEDNVTATQASVGPMALHKYILRTSFDDNTFGEAIAEGSIATGTEFENTFTTTMADNWKADNLYYAAVIWQEVDGQYTYVNGSQVKETVVSSIVDRALLNKVQASWTATDNAHQLILQSDKSYEEVSIELVDMKGQLISTQMLPYLSRSEQFVPLATENLPAGTYAVRISHPEFQTSILLVK